MLRKSRALDGLSEMVRTLTSNRGDDPTAPSCTYSFCELVRYEVTCTHGQRMSVVEKPHGLDILIHMPYTLTTRYQYPSHIAKDI